LKTNGVDLADVGVDAEAEDHHLQQGDHQGKEKRGRIAADVQRFFEEYGAETAEKIKHGPPRFPPDAYRLILRIRLRGSRQRTNLTDLNSVLEELRAEIIEVETVFNESVNGLAEDGGAANAGELASQAQGAGDFRRGDFNALGALRLHIGQFAKGIGVPSAISRPK